MFCEKTFEKFLETKPIVIYKRCGERKPHKPITYTHGDRPMKYEIMQLILDSKIEFLYTDSYNREGGWRTFTFRQNKLKQAIPLVSKLLKYIEEKGGKAISEITESSLKLSVME